jgi:hypothetical protein
MIGVRNLSPGSATLPDTDAHRRRTITSDRHKHNEQDHSQAKSRKREGQITAREVEDIEERSSPRTPVIYEIVSRLGEEEMARPVVSLWWSGVAAGMSISFSLLAQAIRQCSDASSDQDFARSCAISQSNDACAFSNEGGRTAGKNNDFKMSATTSSAALF